MARTRDNESTPLHEVATGEVAELLIQGKADVNSADEWELRPLHYAAQTGNCDVARCLIVMYTCLFVRIYACVYVLCMYVCMWYVCMYVCM